MSLCWQKRNAPTMGSSRERDVLKTFIFPSLFIEKAQFREEYQRGMGR